MKPEAVIIISQMAGVLPVNEDMKPLMDIMTWLDVRVAGYPLVNTTILSSRSVGSLAASWAVYRYLGEESYRLNARKVWRARDSIIKGLKELWYTV